MTSIMGHTMVFRFRAMRSEVVERCLLVEMQLLLYVTLTPKSSWEDRPEQLRRDQRTLQGCLCVFLFLNKVSCSPCWPGMEVRMTLGMILLTLLQFTMWPRLALTSFSSQVLGSQACAWSLQASVRKTTAFFQTQYHRMHCLRQHLQAPGSRL